MTHFSHINIACYSLCVFNGQSSLYRKAIDLLTPILFFETPGRSLVVRYKEHYRSEANPTALSYKNMAFVRHYMECHPAQEPKSTVKVQKKTSGSLDQRVTKEGLFIQMLKPELNNTY